MSRAPPGTCTLAPTLVYRDGEFQRDLAIRFSTADGRISAVLPAADAGDDVVRLPARAILPGFVNAHSHAFQRLIRGRTQWRPARARAADFWSWREAMYAAALSLDADDVFVASRFCFLEMLRAGFTAVGEFHYLHRDPEGRRYDDGAELAKRVIEAATSVGLRIRLLHVAYATGGIREPLRPEQRRFATPDLDEYLADVSKLGTWCAGRPLAAAGCAPHSVRAVPTAWLAPIHALAREHDLPYHIHASEQPAEVAASSAAYGRRPIELLADRGVLDDRTTVVHATHIDATEIGLLGGGATVCACPTTERDLGDGSLAAEELLAAGARIALGSDSHTIIAPLDEMRLIEYHERLHKLRRVVLAKDGRGGRDAGATARAEVAPTLLDMGTTHGAHALRLEAGSIAPGTLADLIAADLDHPAIAGWTPATLSALLALSAPPDVITDTWVGGVQRVENRRHVADEEAAEGFRALAARLP